MHIHIYIYILFVSFLFFDFLLTPGPIPLDPGRDSVQNDGTFASVALVCTQLVSKTMFLIPVKIHVFKFVRAILGCRYTH